MAQTWHGQALIGKFKKQYNVTCHLCFKLVCITFLGAIILEFIFSIMFMSQSSLSLKHTVGPWSITTWVLSEF